MTSAYSEPVTASVTLEGVWLHDPDDPEGTALQLRYGRSRRSGVVEVEAQDNTYAGRTYPVTDYGPHEREVVAVEATSTDRADVDAVQALIRSRKPLHYRDNRGRGFPARIVSATDRDEDHGAMISFSVARRDG